MSRENAELARRLIDAFSRGDLEATLDAVAPEFEAHPSGLFVDIGEVYRGREGWAEFWHRFHSAWELITATVDRVEDLGDRVLALGTFHGTGRGSGVEVTRESAWLLTFSDGLVTAVSSFGGWEEALQAVGLSE